MLPFWAWGSSANRRITPFFSIEPLVEILDLFLKGHLFPRFPAVFPLTSLTEWPVVTQRGCDFCTTFTTIRDDCHLISSSFGAPEDGRNLVEERAEQPEQDHRPDEVTEVAEDEFEQLHY
jgi:hypothetical protein